MAKRKMVGKGITRHEQVSWDFSDPADRRAYRSELEGYVDPRCDFVGWLDQREAQIAEALDHFHLPAPNKHVAFDTKNPRDWQYADEPTGPRTHARTEHYLQAFGYQSSFWYLGRLLFHIHMCRSALKAQSFSTLAGHALELGRIEREIKLKFSGEKRLRNFERHVDGSNKGNRTRKAKASAWQELARKMATRCPDIDLANRSAAARMILERWPTDDPMKPSPSSLRRYLASWQNGPCCQI